MGFGTELDKFSFDRGPVFDGGEQWCENCTSKIWMALLAIVKKPSSVGCMCGQINGCEVKPGITFCKFSLAATGSVTEVDPENPTKPFAGVSVADQEMAISTNVFNPFT